MTALDRARREAAELLQNTTGPELPEWRVTFVGSPDEANAIGPVCTDEDHTASEDPTAFECCPEPVIEVPPALAEYLVALLNADRAQQAGKDTPAGGESTCAAGPVPYGPDRCMHDTSINVECGGCGALGQIGGEA